MSTLKVNTIQNTSGVEVYTAKAWVNFDGTFGTSPFTVANGGIRAAGNVSSVTDLGTGWYQVNFSTAFADTNYCLTSTVVQTVQTGNQGKTAGVYLQNPSYVQVGTGFMEGSPQYRDCTSVFIAIFR